jgi:hypothetical protein
VAAPAFIAAHLALAAAFVREQPLARRDLPLLLAPAAAALVFARVAMAGVAGGRAMVLVVYLLALVAMLWRALCAALAQHGLRTATRIVGAILFFTTDLMTLAEIIEGGTAHARWIWMTYPPALICLAWSCWGPHRPTPATGGRTRPG